MSDWAQPVLTSLYIDVLGILKARDIDTGTLFNEDSINTPEKAIRFLRANNVFQEYISGVWTTKILGVAGGGTGASNATDIRTNLGLGTMAVQNANNVAITGGTISGIASFAVSGNITAGSFTGSGAALTNLNAANITTGVLPDSTLPDPLPTRNAYYLYNLNASNLAHGTVATARLGSGTPGTTTFLRGDQTWSPPPGAGGIPSGAVIFFTTPCPPGFTHIAGWNGYYVRMGGSHVAGGSNTHSHGPGSYSAPSHSHTAGTLNTPSHNHGGSTGTVSVSGSTGSGGGHSHGFGGSISGRTGDDRSGQMNVDAGGSGNMSRGPHNHDFGANFSGETDSVGNHSHSFSGSGSGSIPSQGSQGINGSTASGGGGGISGESDGAYNMPLYIDFFACMKD